MHRTIIGRLVMGWFLGMGFLSGCGQPAERGRVGGGGKDGAETKPAVREAASTPDSGQREAPSQSSASATQPIDPSGDAPSVTVAPAEIEFHPPALAQLEAARAVNGGWETSAPLSADVKMTFVIIPAGEFRMGSPEDEQNRYVTEGPQHTVTIPRPFYLGKFEVTQLEWTTVMGTNPSSNQGPDFPVENVSWEDCQSFCEKASRQTGRKIRLPSESEWEYASRAGTTTRYFFGDDDQPLGGFAVFAENAPLRPTRSEKERKWRPMERISSSIGTKKPNPWGLYDIYGNVSEWCQDAWNVDYAGAPVDGSSWMTGSIEVAHVLRNCAFNHYHPLCRSALRNRLNKAGKFPYIGLRLVMETP